MPPVEPLGKTDGLDLAETRKEGAEVGDCGRERKVADGELWTVFLRRFRRSFLLLGMREVETMPVERRAVRGVEGGPSGVARLELEETVCARRLRLLDGALPAASKCRSTAFTVVLKFKFFT